MYVPQILDVDLPKCFGLLFILGYKGVSCFIFDEVSNGILKGNDETISDIRGTQDGTNVCNYAKEILRDIVYLCSCKQTVLVLWPAAE